MQMVPRSVGVPRAAVLLACVGGLACSVPVTVDGNATGGDQKLRISPPGATFVGRQMVTLSSRDAAEIHYTVDGSVPGMSSPRYQGPLALDGPAVVRARRVKDGKLEPDVVSATFMPVADGLRGWTSNLPVIVLHTHGHGPLAPVDDAPRVAGSVTVLTPAGNGRTSLVGQAALGARAGLRTRGASSLLFPQKSYSIEFRQSGSDEDAALPLLGLTAEADFALVGGALMDRSLMRNALAYAVSNSIGRWAARTRFVEVFLVEDGGQVKPADYKGVYTLVETIKRDPARLNLPRLDPAATSGPALTGSYIVRIDGGNSHFSIGMTRFQYFYPKWEEINVPARAPQRAYLEGYLREFLDAIGTSDFSSPRTGQSYRELIDVPSFIDHNLINVLFKNIDALRISAYFYKPPGGKLFAGPVWDFDRSAGTGYDDDIYAVPRAQEAREWARDDGTHPLTWGFWARLFEDPAFKQAHAQRWDQLAAGPMSVPTLHRLIDGLAGELREAQARHFARWPEMPAAGGSHDNEVRILKDWFAARVPWLNDQL
jgi:hypothetical protein